jgi:UMP-CMP kinase
MKSEYASILQQCEEDSLPIPSELAINLIKTNMESFFKHGKTMFVFDDFPRDGSDMSTWNSLMGPYVKMPLSILLDCPQDTCLERILKVGRASATGPHPSAMQLSAANQEFQKNIMPICKVLADQGLLQVVPASGTFDEVRINIRRVTEKYAEVKSFP